MAGDSPDFGIQNASASLRVALIRSMWHGELTNALTSNAVEALTKAGVPLNNIHIIDAPGTYELPLLAKIALQNGFDGAIVFGIVVDGETHHAKLIAEAAAQGCIDVQLESGKPVIFEVLYVDKFEDARTRSIGKYGKGPIAAATLLKQLDEIRKLRQ